MPNQKKSSKKVLLIIVGVLVLCCGIGAIFSPKDSKSSSTTTTSSQTTQSNNQVVTTNITTTQATTTEAPKIPSIGETVKVGNISWTVKLAKDMGNTLNSGNQYISNKTTSGKFVKVTFSIKNEGSDKIMLVEVPVVDSMGREFSESNDMLYFIPTEEMLVLGEVNPGITKTYTSIYDVPTDATGLKFKVSNLQFWTKETKDISLGL